VAGEFSVGVDHVGEPAAAKSGAKVVNLKRVVPVVCVSELSELPALVVAVTLVVDQLLVAGLICRSAVVDGVFIQLACVVIRIGVAEIL